ARAHTRMQCVEHLEVLRNKARFENQVLGRITGNGQLRRQDQLRASPGETLVSAHDLLKIAAQIANRRVELGKANLHALTQVMRDAALSNPFCWGAHAPSRAQFGASPN